MGEEVKIVSKGISKQYNPISAFDTLGYADFLVDDREVFELEKGQKVETSGVEKRVRYLGDGWVEVEGQGRQCRYLGVVVEGVQIQRVFQMLESIATSKDTTCLSLLYVVDSLEEAALVEELGFFKELGKVHINILVREGDYGLDSGVMQGALSNRVLEDYLPPPAGDVQVLVAGSYQFKSYVLQYLTSHHYTNDMFYIY